MKRKGSHVAKRLTAIEVSASKPGTKVCDGGGLWLYTDKSGSRRWVFRATLNGRRRDWGLGSGGLAGARERAAQARKLIEEGKDPSEHRKALLAAQQAERVTFKDCAEAYIKAHRPSWKNAKHRQQWENTLATYAYPSLGSLSVAAIDTAQVSKVLEPIWAEKPETAARLRGRIEAVIDWARTRGYTRGDNPARWRGHLENLLPAQPKSKRVRHHPAMPYQDVPAFMADLRAKDGISARALELTILCATRTNETLGARWDETDLTSRVWTIPASRTKARREHRIPLSERAVEILTTLPHDSDFVFPGTKRGRPLSNMTLLKLLRGMRAGLTVHGFRTAFSTWANETGAARSDVIEASLAHIEGDKVRGAYNRASYAAERRKLMEAWDAFCTTPRCDNVITLGASARIRNDHALPHLE